jgi:hypothetical protein
LHREKAAAEPEPEVGAAAAEAGVEPAAEPEPEAMLPESEHPYFMLYREVKKIADAPVSSVLGMVASTRQPQNALSGFGSGAKTFVKCASLGAAALVGTPIAAFRVACAEGGTAGAAVLVAGGATALVAGVAAVAVPSVQFARGIAATPEAIQNSYEGMEWDYDNRVWRAPKTLRPLESMADLAELLAEGDRGAAGGGAAPMCHARLL